MAHRSRPSGTRLSTWLTGAALLFGLGLMVVFVMREAMAGATLPGLESRTDYSWEVYTRSVLASGHLPYWNPFHFSGTPHLANTQNLVLYPPALALRWLDPVAFFRWLTITHALIGGAGMLFLARIAGAGWVGAAVAGLAFVAGGSTTGWLHHGHLLLLYSAAWLPWAMALAMRSAATSRLLPDVWLVIVLVLQFLTGNPQGSIYTFAAIAAYYGYCAVWPSEGGDRVGTRWRPLAQFIVLCVLVCGVAAFQLWPSIQLAADAGRSAGVGYQAASQDAWRVDDLVSLFLPFHGVTEAPLHRYLGDRTAYIGWLPLVMVPFAFTDAKSRRMATFLTLLAGLAILVALGDHLRVYRLHYLLFPGFRVPGRVLFIVTVALAIAGALGLERFLALCRDRRWRQLTAPALVSIAWAGASIGGDLSTTSASVPPMHGWPWLPMLALGIFVLIAIAGAARRGRIVAALVITFVVVDLGLFSTGAVHAAPATVPHGWSVLPASGGGRTLATCWIDLGEMLESGRSTLDGLGGMYLRDYADWAHVVKVGTVPEGQRLIATVNSLDGTLPVRRDLLDLANVTTVIACTPLSAPGLTEQPPARGHLIYSNQAAWPRAVWTCAAEEVSRADALNRLLGRRYTSDRYLGASYLIHVRWARTLSDQELTRLETAYGLGAGEQTDETTRRYRPRTVDPHTLLMLAANEAVEDTNGFDRDTGQVPGLPSPKAASDGGEQQLLIGTQPCASSGVVQVRALDRPDGEVVVDVDAPVDGYVFFSEPYYRQRRAYVDGARADARKANIAFTAVPVRAGRHRVELRYVPSEFYAGSGVSLLTLMTWLGATRRRTHARTGREVTYT